MFITVKYNGVEETGCLARADNIQNCGAYYTSSVPILYPYQLFSISTLTC